MTVRRIAILRTVAAGLNGGDCRREKTAAIAGGKKRCFGGLFVYYV
jgi:hypothetical protein